MQLTAAHIKRACGGEGDAARASDKVDGGIGQDEGTAVHKQIGKAGGIGNGGRFCRILRNQHAIDTEGGAVQIQEAGLTQGEAVACLDGEVASFLQHVAAGERIIGIEIGGTDCSVFPFVF